MSRVFPEEFKQELLNKTDIVDVVSRYVDLKRKGGKYWGCCPFHNEKTASFNVDVNKQFFYCFGCGKGGNAITFVREMEHMGYVEAVEYLADKAGLAVPSMRDSKIDDEKIRRRKRHYEICKAAADFYYSSLVGGSNKAADYCAQRGISPATVKRFGMGYSPGGGDVLLKHLTAKGFTKEEAVESGLAKESGGVVRDFFFNRLMFPIMDVYSNVIAFGGRILGEGVPKYLNSSDSPLYNKKKHLYGLNIAKKNKQTDRLILVEGYMDVVTVGSFGIGGAVASLGTSLTKEQCLLIRRFTRDVYIAYDGDGAGQKAAVRASKMLMEEGINPRILVFKDGLDPDEYLKKYGAEEFEKLLYNGVLPFEFEIDLLAKSFDLGTENGRRSFAMAALQVQAAIANELDKDKALKDIAFKSGFPLDVLTRERLRLDKTAGNRQNKVIDDRVNNTPKLPVKKKNSRKTNAEALAVKLALNGFKDDILLNLKESDFDEPVYKECFQAVKNGMSTEGEAMERFDRDECRSRIMEVISMPDTGLNKKAVKDCIKTIRTEKLKVEIYYWENALKNSAGQSEDERKNTLLKIAELTKQRNTIEGW